MCITKLLHNVVACAENKHGDFVVPNILPAPVGITAIVGPSFLKLHVRQRLVLLYANLPQTNLTVELAECAPCAAMNMPTIKTTRTHHYFPKLKRAALLCYSFADWASTPFIDPYYPSSFSPIACP